jgi:hypothetical protein
MSCVLRVGGPEFDVDAYLKQSTLRPHDVFRKGERRSKTSSRINEESGFTVTASDADFENLPGQIRDTIIFLREHASELSTLRNFLGVAGIRVDFGFNNRVDGQECAVQVDVFPAELLKLCGEFGIDLLISQY